MREKKKYGGRNVAQLALYYFLHFLARLVAIGFYRIRVFGRNHWPPTDGAVICANHQGYFDPLLVGLTCERPISVLAKKSLFRFPLKPVIEAMGAIPVNREGTGLDGLRVTMQRLKAGEMVLLFPEGTRTESGNIGKLKPGFIAVARKTKVPIVPVVFDGSFQVWPKWQILPTLGIVHVKIGVPISPEKVASLSDEELLAELQAEMQAMLEFVRYTRLQAMNPRVHTADKTQFA